MILTPCVLFETSVVLARSSGLSVKAVRNLNGNMYINNFLYAMHVCAICMLFVTVTLFSDAVPTLADLSDESG